MVRDLTIPNVAAPRTDGSGQAQYGTITQEDAVELALMGAGNNSFTGNFFTVDGNTSRFPTANDVWPDTVVPTYRK